LSFSIANPFIQPTDELKGCDVVHGEKEIPALIAGDQ
jgi:hypothetical protein